MKGEKDEGKQTGPLFPGLHIRDGDKRVPRAPPRNKMALFEDYIGNSQGVELRPRSPRPLLPVPPVSGFLSLPSSSNVAGMKRKVRPVLAAMNECPRSPERYYPHCSGGLSGPSNYQNPRSPSSLMMKAKCTSVQPSSSFSCLSNGCTDENDFSTFRQSGRFVDYGNLQMHVKKEKIDTFSPVSLGKRHGASSKLSKETKSGDQAMGRHGNLGEQSSKLSQTNLDSLDGNRIPEPGIGELQCNMFKKISTSDEMSRSNFSQAQLCLEFKSLHKSKTIADGLSAMTGTIPRSSTSAADDSDRSSPRGGDCLSLKTGDAVKREETSDTYTEGDLAPDEVVRVIGQRLYLKARNTMVHQQKIFSLQMFELHRLIMVQQQIARSPEILHENTFDPNKPSIKFPPINKLLYVSPLDPSPVVAKAKVDTLKSSLDSDCGPEAIRGLLSLPTIDVEKGHLSRPLTPKSLPNPPIDPKLAPWCFPVPTGNQWLVPVRSPSEGLIYKPYPGPCFPSVGYMPPLYGNCAPINLSSLGGATYGIPPSNEHGSGGFCSPELSSYLQQPYPMPSGSNQELKQNISSAGAQAGEPDKSSSSNFFVPHQIPCKVSSQQSTALVSYCGGNLHRSNGSEMQGSTETSHPERRLEGDALSLFPTTPSLKEQSNEQRVHAIKVVPHTRMSASASAARIFQSIQEERRSKHEILLELAVRALGEKNTTYTVFNYKYISLVTLISRSTYLFIFLTRRNP